MIVFGISKARAAITLTQEYEYPVLTVMTRPNVEKMSYRLNFNRAAINQLYGHRTEYTIGEDINEETGASTFFLMDVAQLPNVETNVKFKIAYNGNVNNQKLWKHFRKAFNVPEETFRLKLEQISLGTYMIWKLTPFEINAEASVQPFETGDNLVEEELFSVMTEELDNALVNPFLQ